MEPVTHLIRVHHAKDCTLGILYLEDADLATPQPRLSKTYTIMEPPWNDNKPGASCVPAGSYMLRRYWSRKFNCELFGITDLPGAQLLTGRVGIAIHWGNKAYETKGCPLIGRGMLLDPPLIEHSKDAFQEFMKILAPFKTLPLRIQHV